MIKINCELPYCMFNENLSLNEYDFVLFHLYSTDEEYKEYYKKVREEHPDRVMIFDNSAYEFFVQGKKLVKKHYLEAINDLKPDYYILPDTLMNMEKTLKDSKSFLKNYPVSCDAKPLAIAQGNTERELVNCLEEYLKMGIKCIGLPFHNSFFTEMDVDDDIKNQFSKVYPVVDEGDDQKYAMGRVQFTRNHDELLCKFDYVHLLGSHCPFEKRFYHEFDSMDTSYPVKLGVEYVSLETERKKPETIIDNIFKDALTEIQKTMTKYNIDKFKAY